MAVTGTGSINDPFVVSTWAELVATATDDTKYIKCADNCVWDFNSIEPDGLTPVTLHCAGLDGNGVILLNINFHDNTTYGIWFYPDTSIEIKNFNIINAYVHDTGEYGFLAFANRPVVTGCQISALVGNGRLICHNSTFKFCGFNIKSSGSSDLGFNFHSEYNDYINVENSILEFGGNSDKPMTDNLISYNTGFRFSDCKFIGTNPYTNLSSIYNVVDVDMNINGDEFDDVSNPTLLLVNSDKVEDAAALHEGVYALTASQLTDVSYLQSIGFPVV